VILLSFLFNLQPVAPFFWFSSDLSSFSEFLGLPSPWLGLSSLFGSAGVGMVEAWW
jgi:hypothetical protein